MSRIMLIKLLYKGKEGSVEVIILGRDVIATILIAHFHSVGPEVYGICACTFF